MERCSTFGCVDERALVQPLQRWLAYERGELVDQLQIRIRSDERQGDGGFRQDMDECAETAGVRHAVPPLPTTVRHTSLSLLRTCRPDCSTAALRQ